MGALRTIAALLCLSVLLWPSAPSAATGERIALVVGNGAYRHVDRLRNPPNDAKLIASTLDDAGFDLIGGKPLLDAGREDIEKAIREFGRRIRGASAAVFYYAGHGIQMNGINYLVPVTANVSSEADVRYELVDIGLVLDAMAGNERRMNIVVLDACRNNPFGGRGMRSSAGGLAQMQAPAGTVIGYATQPGALAADGDGGNSPYTAALAEAMRRPGNTVFDVFNNVGVSVMRKTGGGQQPWFSTSPLDGEFHFFAPTGAAKPPPPGPGADREVVFWNSIKDSGDASMFQAYLQQFPGGTFRLLAESKLRTLTPVPAPPQVAATIAPPAPPPAPAFAGSFNASAVPYVKASDRATLEKYGPAPSPKALAIGSNGSFSFTDSRNGPRSVSDVTRAALQQCQFRNGAPCVLYALNNQVAVKTTAGLQPTPVSIRESGAFVASEVPFVSDAVRSGGMVNYETGRSPKAIAISSTGAWGTVTNKTGNVTPERATQVALDMCEFLAQRTCVLYAVDNRLVTPEGTSMKTTAARTRKTGAFRASEVPFITTPEALAAMETYASRPGYKAVALHWNGTYGYVTRQTTEESARKTAMEYCAKHEPEGCFIYAVGDEIVWEVP